MAKIFTEYVIKLNEDVEELTRFKKNPDACIAAAGLKKEHGDALKSKDHVRIQAVLNAENVGVQPLGHIQVTALINKLK